MLEFNAGLLSVGISIVALGSLYLLFDHFYVVHHNQTSPANLAAAEAAADWPDLSATTCLDLFQLLEDENTPAFRSAVIRALSLAVPPSSHHLVGLTFSIIVARVPRTEYARLVGTQLCVPLGLGERENEVAKQETMRLIRAEVWKGVAGVVNELLNEYGGTVAIMTSDNLRHASGYTSLFAPSVDYVILLNGVKNLKVFGRANKAYIGRGGLMVLLNDA